MYITLILDNKKITASVFGNNEKEVYELACSLCTSDKSKLHSYEGDFYLERKNAWWRSLVHGD